MEWKKGGKGGEEEYYIQFTGLGPWAVLVGCWDGAVALSWCRDAEMIFWYGLCCCVAFSEEFAEFIIFSIFLPVWSWVPV